MGSKRVNSPLFKMLNKSLTENSHLRNVLLNIFMFVLESNFIQSFPKQALFCTCLQHKSFENTVEKGEIARNEQFLLFPQCFLPISKTFSHFHQI